MFSLESLAGGGRLPVPQWENGCIYMYFENVIKSFGSNPISETSCTWETWLIIRTTDLSATTKNMNHKINQDARLNSRLFSEFEYKGT